ncbi:hypothetical protein FOMPIDRAFT_131394 [Fomitopsis schrenkii]|uniref:Uncharacterized protein n=1 Tax=Fomitopsis schrenkii TaxID=2126942 RepID=S8F237_FOMSC|nr:hypothetical protein FOMPIDRAFT_131394 [Fomitopsis schrenkii]
MFFTLLFGIFLYRLDFSAFYPPVPPGVEICFAGVADDCHYRGDIYRGPEPTHYWEEDRDFSELDVDELYEGRLETAVLFVRLSGGRRKSLPRNGVDDYMSEVHVADAVIFSRNVSHIPHHVMHLSGWTTFTTGIGSCSVTWTHIDGNTIHLYQAMIKDREKFNLLINCFDENTVPPPPDVNEFSEDLAEHEIVEICRRFKACLRYGAFNQKTRDVIERVCLAYRQLWAVIFIYVCWHVLVSIP